jgi:hypothetical protein
MKCADFPPMIAFSELSLSIPVSEWTTGSIALRSSVIVETSLLRAQRTGSREAMRLPEVRISLPS